MKPITHHLTEQQIKRLQEESKRTGLSVAELIRRALDAWMEKLDNVKEGR